MDYESENQGAVRICLGVVTGAHGLHGLLRVRTFTEVPEDVGAYGPVQSEDGTREYDLKVRNRTGKGQILVHIEGVANRDVAEALKGEHFYVPRARLPEPDADEFYNADLLGLDVVSSDGKALGTVRALHNFGGGDMLEVVDDAGRLGTVAFTRVAVPEINLLARRVTVESAAMLWSGGPNDKAGPWDRREDTDG